MVGAQVCLCAKVRGQLMRVCSALLWDLGIKLRLPGLHGECLRVSYLILQVCVTTSGFSYCEIVLTC